MNVLLQLKIGARLAVAFATMLVLIVVVALTGWWGGSRMYDEAETIYQDRTVPLHQLGQINYLLQRNRVLVMDLLLDHDFSSLQKRDAELEKNLGLIDSNWQAYMATQMTDEEKQLAEAFAKAKEAYVKEGLLPLREALRQEASAPAPMAVAPSPDTEGAAAMAAPPAQTDDVAMAVYKNKVSPLSPAVRDSLDALLALQVKVAADEFDNAKSINVSMKLVMLLITGAALAIGALLSLLITRSIVKPIGEAVEVAHHVAKGDLTSHIHVQGNDEMADLLQSLRTMNENLVKVVGEVRQSSDHIATGSAEIATGNADLSHRTEEQASSLEETAASMEELTVTVKHNADTARQASQLAQGASEAALKGGEVVGQVVSTMQDITHSSQKIADIISVIDGIAFQTNILALNAAVEAARAGEQGRGFAVVAGEVRSLAQRSAEAAKEIKELITASVERVQAGSSLVEVAGHSMEDIVSQVKRVTDLIGEITAASVEQSSGIGQVGQAVSHLDQMTQQNAALVEQSAAAAESLKQQAVRLTQAVGVFKLNSHDERVTTLEPVLRPTAPVAKPKAPAAAIAARKPVALAGKAAKASPSASRKEASAARPAVTAASSSQVATASRPSASKPLAIKPPADDAEGEWTSF